MYAFSRNAFVSKPRFRNDYRGTGRIRDPRLYLDCLFGAPFFLTSYYFSCTNQRDKNIPNSRGERFEQKKKNKKSDNKKKKRNIE